MDHKAIKEKLFDLYDGELAPDERREAEAHLSACLECRELYEGWQKTAKALFKASKPQTSEFFIRQVMSKIHESEKPKEVGGWGVSLRWFVPSVGLAAILFAVMPLSETPLSMDMLLLNPQDAGSSLLYGKTLTMDDTLDFVIGEQI